MATRKKEKQRGTGCLWVLALLIVLVAFGVVLFGKFKQQLTTRTAAFALSKVVEQQTGVAVDVQPILDQMDEEDQAQLNSILGKYMTGDALQAAVSAYQSGNYDELKTYVSEKVDTADTQELMDLYSKYQDVVNDTVTDALGQAAGGAQGAAPGISSEDLAAAQSDPAAAASLAEQYGDQLTDEQKAALAGLQG